MDLVEFSPAREQYTYTFGGVAPVMKIRPGTALRVWSDDAFGGVLRSVDDLSGEKVDLRYVNPQTGPFFVEGAEPGDTLVLHFVAMEPARDWGASAAIPFFGGMTSTDRVATLQDPLPDTTWIYQLDRDAKTVTFSARFSGLSVALPIAPMLGTVGVAPAAGEVRTSLVPDRFGGNMDSPEIRAGATVYLGVNVEGALFSVGDGHYRQGEGEACGTAVEGAMTTTFIVELIKGGAPGWPRIEDDQSWITVGSSRPLEDSWRIGNAELVRWMGRLHGLHIMDAYQLLSQVTEAPVANVVDANYSVAVKAPKSLLPPASAYDGIHAELRRRALSL
jgi:acetamidase/formamidase